MPRADRTGLERLRALAQALPNDLLRGFRSGEELRAPLPAGERPLFATGMGASAIAADLARGLVDAETSATLVVVRGPDLPRAADGRSLVLVVSYSGETTETLEAYDLAGRRGARRLVITSGGHLAEKADDDGVPVLRVPGGNPPRSAIGHLFGGVLGLLDPLFAESNEHRLAVATRELEEAIRRLSSPSGPASVLAGRIGTRFPTIVAERSFVPLARRWASQIEENAKRLAAFDELPEALHNSVAAWDALAPGEAADHALVLLDWAGESPLLRRAARHLERIARSCRVRVLEAALTSEDRLAALVHGVALGDHVSLELARRRRVDPYAIAAIAEGRAALAAVGNGAAAGETLKARTAHGREVLR